MHGGCTSEKGSFWSCRYRFCVTMEISRSRDYVTEKLYDAFEGGCLPIYFGAPNIADFLPHAESIIDYQKLGSPEALLAELLRINANPHEWRSRVAWRTRPIHDLQPGYRRLVELSESQHSQCRLCGVIMDHRMGDCSALMAHRQNWPANTSESLQGGLSNSSVRGCPGQTMLKSAPPDTP